MGFVKFDENGHLLDAAGNQVHIVGVNYVASYICSNFWEDWRPETIEKDLAKIHELGLNAVRIPMHWGFMEPERGKYNADFSRKFDAFIEMCRKYELYIMPWFLVGIATNEYDVPFRNGKPFCSGEMVKVEEEHLKHFIAPYKDEELILFWDICDEPEWFSRFPGAAQLPYDREEMARWVKTMYDAIRSVDKNHLITLGFGHIATANYGMDVRDMAQILDLMVVTAYPQGAPEGLDSVRNNYCVPFHVKMNDRGNPTFTCEAPGYSSIAYSEEIIGRYFKTSIYSNLLSGSTGVLPWVYNDFERSLWHDKPLEGYLIEPNFGIITNDGRVKPSGCELSKFAAFVKKAEMGKYRPQKAEVAVLVPDGYYSSIGSTYYKLYTTYLLAKGCGTNVDLVWTTEDLSAYKLLLIPATDGMVTSSWDKVRRYVENGGMIYHVFDGPALNAYFNELFGVEVQTGERDFGYQSMTAKEDWGCWKTGDEIAFTGTDRGHVLRVRERNAKTVFALDDGEAALLKNHYGKGVAYLAALPLDNGLMKIPYREYLATKSVPMLDAMMTEADVSRAAKIVHPAMEVGVMVKDKTGERLVICVSHNKLPADVKLEVADGWELRSFETGEKTCGNVHFEPAGVAVYKLAEV